MTSYQQLITENQRLAILKFLKDDGDYKLNTSILQDGLTAIGLDISRDKLETEVAWLQEQGLVQTEQFKSVVVVVLTGRGLDVAEGKANVPGVKRPRPCI